ncbi:MAG: hypothetical protein V8S22_07940 [Lachnospiraceae bacterium]
MNHMHATYQAIADSHGIPFYDMNFYTEKNTVFNRELFRDIVHLNRNGAEIYTGLIAEIHESGDAYPTYFTEEIWVRSQNLLPETSLIFQFCRSGLP